MPEYPEHDKLRGVRDTSQAIGEFLDWLGEQGMRLMEYRTFTDRHLCRDCGFNHGPTGKRWSSRVSEWYDCPTCGGSGLGKEFEVEEWVPTPSSTIELLARYFEIDLDKIEAEKRAMLEHLRAIS